MWVQTTRNHGEAPRWYSPTLWQTMTAGAWWNMLSHHGFRIPLRSLPQAAAISALTAASSVVGLLQSALYAARLQAAAIMPDPIFVVGHYRAGTSHLHNLLALDERLSFPTTYECAAPHHCLLTGWLYPRLFSWMLPERRVQDGMKLGLDLPQEDELGLIALGAPSPYWSIGFPGGHAGEPFLGLRAVTDAQREQWERIFLSFLRLISLRHPGRPLVLKSPPHTARIAVLSRLFPGARFVHIVRDPLEVFVSSVGLWRSVRAANALTAWDEDAIEQEVLSGLLEMYRDFDAARMALPAGHFHQVRYEDLVRAPLDVLAGCYAAIGLGDLAAVRPRVERYLESLGGYRTNEYEIAAQGRAAVRAAWGALFSRWGYEIN